MLWAKRPSIHLLVAGCVSLAAMGTAARGSKALATGWPHPNPAGSAGRGKAAFRSPNRYRKPRPPQAH